MTALFSPLALSGAVLKNRIVVSPMCQYSAGPDGRANDWHLVHLGAFAVGGAALVFTEATAVERRGRISEADLGLYEEAQIAPLARISAFIKEQGALAGIQLAHAGRKAYTGAKGRGPDLPVGPSDIPFDEGFLAPAALDEAGLSQVKAAFVEAAKRAGEAGFDVIELHSAHGYLLHSFLSPLANRRRDAYGGDIAGRSRLLREIAAAVRAAWPRPKALFARLSCSDWVDGGFTIDEAVQVSRELFSLGVDAIDCSSGGAVPRINIPVGPGYQVPFAEKIRREAGGPTCAVGMLTAPEHAEEIVKNGRADLVALARELLRDPRWPQRAAKALGADIAWPRQYSLAKR